MPVLTLIDLPSSYNDQINIKSVIIIIYVLLITCFASQSRNTLHRFLVNNHRIYIYVVIDMKIMASKFYATPRLRTSTGKFDLLIPYNYYIFAYVANYL